MGGYGSVSEDYVGSSEQTVLIEEDLRLQNPVKVLEIYQIVVLGDEMFICKKFKKEKLEVRHISLSKYKKEVKNKGKGFSIS